MRLRWVNLLVLMTVLFQALAVAQVPAAVAKSSDLLHHVLHWTDEAHHHHDDGSWHIDDSAASSQHVVTDHLSNPAALPHSCAPAPLVRDHAAPRAVTPSGLSPPHLEGLLRPPRSA